MSTPYQTRDLGAEYQSGITGLLGDAWDWYVKSGISPLSPYHPIHNQPEIRSKQDLVSLLEDPSYAESLPTLDPSGLGKGLIGVAGMAKSRGLPWEFVKKDADFYVQTKGSNAGKVMKEPSANSIGVKVDRDHLLPDYAYYLFQYGDMSGGFKQRHKGTAQPYITHGDIDDVITDILMRRK